MKSAGSLLSVIYDLRPQVLEGKAKDGGGTPGVSLKLDFGKGQNEPDLGYTLICEDSWAW